ncbi:response regulator [Nevskia soli]|uniref:response regulator n=1 Tax=Nevskia soli TaxID=418856 RepID=UPI0015D93C57|nr:response regulator [Nevskia soli]
MPRQANTRMLVAVSDLFFMAKILDAAKRALMQPEIVKTSADVLERAKSAPALVIVDLNFDALEPVKTILALKQIPEAKGTSVIAFVSHVQAELKMSAHEAGCDMVLARSAFSQNLPQILKRYSGVI